MRSRWTTPWEGGEGRGEDEVGQASGEARMMAGEKTADIRHSSPLESPGTCKPQEALLGPPQGKSQAVLWENPIGSEVTVDVSLVMGTHLLHASVSISRKLPAHARAAAPSPPVGPCATWQWLRRW